MKIVYCLPQIYNPGGIERTTSLKANYFVDIKGWDVVIITANQDDAPPYYPLSEKVKLIDLGIDYTPTLAMPILKRLYYRRKLLQKHKKRLSALLFQEKADFVVSTFGSEAAFLPSIKDGSKKILEFHFCRGHKRMVADAYHYPFLTKLAFYYRCWQEENVIVPKYDQFVVLTEQDKQNWIKDIPNVVCIPNALTFENEGKALLKNKHAIAVGRLDAQKGFDRLIDIWAMVVKQHEDWILDIYGQGADYKMLEQQILRNGLSGKVILHGATKHIKEKYLESSIFLMTSVFEGIGMNLLEAVGLGLPSVCFTFPCGPKDIISDKENGFLVEDGDKDKFVKRVCQLMADEKLRRTIGENAIHMAGRYSKDNIMRKWVALFEK